MSAAVFGADYAHAYDLLYADKDYNEECDLLEQVFAKYADGEVRSVLDLGCGTGTHAFLLAERGYELTGVDISAEMLDRAHARGKVWTGEAKAEPPDFRLGDIRSLDLGRKFDAVVMMFAVLGYQRSNADVRSALAAVRNHLRVGGVFACDVWYGPAVLAQRPGERIKVMDFLEGQVIRAATSQLNTREHLCSVAYRVWELRNGSLLTEAQEVHFMRYFFPMELELLLEEAGMAMRSLTAFPTLSQPADESTWNGFVVAT